MIQNNLYSKTLSTDSQNSMQSIVTNDSKHYKKTTTCAPFNAPVQIRSKQEKEKISDTLLQLQEDKQVQVLFSGSIYRYVTESGNFKLLNRLCIFCINELTDCEFTFTVFDLNRKQLYEGIIDEQLNYQTNHQENYFKWLHKKEQIKIFLFQFDPFDASLTARVQIERNIIKRQFKNDILWDKEQEGWIQQYQENNYPSINQTPNEEQKDQQYNYNDALRAQLQSENSETEFETPTNNLDINTQTILQPLNIKNNSKEFETPTDNSEINPQPLQTLKKKYNSLRVINNQQIAISSQNNIEILNWNKETGYSLMQRIDISSNFDYHEKIMFSNDLTRIYLQNQNKLLCVDKSCNIIFEHSDENLIDFQLYNDVCVILSKKEIYFFKPEQKLTRIENSFPLKYDFSALAVSKEGNFIIGTSAGDILVFSDLLKPVLLNRFPALGKQIHYIQIDSSGKYFVVTMKSQILVFPIVFKGNHLLQKSFEELPFPQTLEIPQEFLLGSGIKEVHFKSSQIFATFNYYTVINTFENMMFIWFNDSKAQPFFTVKYSDQKILDAQFRSSEDDTIFCLNENGLSHLERNPNN